MHQNILTIVPVAHWI